MDLRYCYAARSFNLLGTPNIIVLGKKPERREKLCFVTRLSYTRPIRSFDGPTVWQRQISMPIDGVQYVSLALLPEIFSGGLKESFAPLPF